jgi:hypothetical protein
VCGRPVGVGVRSAEMRETASSRRVGARCCRRVDGRAGLARGVPRLARGRSRSHHLGSPARAPVRAALPGRVLPDRRRATGPAPALVGRLPARRGAGRAGGLLGRQCCTTRTAPRIATSPRRSPSPAAASASTKGWPSDATALLPARRAGWTTCGAPARFAPLTTWDARTTSSRRWWRSTASRTGTASHRISCCTSVRTTAAAPAPAGCAPRWHTPTRTRGRRWRPVFA